MIRRTVLAGLLLAGTMGLAAPGFAGPASGTHRPVPVPADSYLPGRFTMHRHLAGFEAPLTSHGRFFLAPARGLAWLTDTPFPDTLVLDDRGIVRFTDPDRPERLAGGHQMRVVTDMIAGILAGDWSRLSRGFSVDTAAVEGSRGGWRATLVPTPEGVIAAQITRITVLGADTVTDVVLEKPGGDRDVLVLVAGHQAPRPLPPDIGALFAAAAALE